VKNGRAPAPADPAIAIRAARLADVTALMPLMAPFNRSEAIPWRPRLMVRALRRLLREPQLGAVLVAVRTGPVAARSRRARLVGYVIATFNYDLEFAGPDAFVTELFVDPAVRMQGVGRTLLAAMVERLRAEGALAVHLLVRPDNLAARLLYESAGFEEVPRLMMTLQPGRRPPRRRRA
jgi:ribosomal protein S18 acetylase RimI-like enzyme